MSYIVTAYQSATHLPDDTNDNCTDDHTYERMNPWTGHFSLYAAPCTCNLVQVGIVNGRKRYDTTSAELPF